MVGITAASCSSVVISKCNVWAERPEPTVAENLAIWTEGLISQERPINNGPKSDDGWDALEPCQILVDTKSEASEGINEAQAHLDQNVLAPLRHGSPGLNLGLAGGLFSAAARPPVSARSPFGANVALENRD